jgi:probable DNA repair protein
MRSFTDTLAQLDTDLAGGALALVPNYRSSDQLIDALCAWRRRHGAPAVQPRPAIVAIDLWLSDLWRALAQLDDARVLASRLLSTGEEQLLWSRLISEAAPDLLLLNPEGTASTLAAGYRLLQQWQIPLDTLRAQLSLTDETLDDRARAFTWFKAFENHCNQEQCLTFSGSVQALCALIAAGRLEPLGLLPRTILLWGFDQPPPLYRALFEALEQRGVAIARIEVAERQPALRLVRCAQPDEEALAAARWAAEVLRQDPEACIGLVTADSDLLKGALARACSRVFHATPDAFTNTLSAALSDDAWVHAALTVLELDREHLPTTTALALLRSPWLLAQEEELDARAELELRLRQKQSEATRLAELRRLCLQEDKPWYCPQLGAALAALQQARLRQPRQLPLSGWLERFEPTWQLLLPRERLLTAGRRALLSSWEQLLRTLYVNDSHERLSAAQALRSLRAHCRHTTLALGKRQAPVLLLTPVTATGMNFTHLWCLQMTDDYWPGEQRPHPYLPLALQREHGMPAASPEAALAESRLLFESLLRHTAQEVVCSYAAVADDLPQRPTTLLPAALVAQEQTPVAAASLHLLVAEQLGQNLEIVADATTLPVRTASNSGGASLIASQSACPFQAFARYRLHLREVPPLEFGIPHHAIGSCVHEALQVFWNRLQSSDTLHALTGAELERQLREALRPALARVARDYPLLMSPALQTLEEMRLTQLLLRWLEQEKQRAPFTLQHTELALPLQLSTLRLDLRIDRVDRLADGSVAIVDYKTGRRLSRDWDSERPEAPQLLLYELAWSQHDAAAPSHALLYAQLNVEAVGYAGIAGDDSLGLPLALERFTNAAPDWNALRVYWQRVLTLLADEFLQGYAAVQPARRDSCTYCHYRALCRIDAQAVTGETP